MQAGGKTNEELERENAELRARLAEAEETLRAIREGEVDSLLIATPGGERVYTLEGADHTYRILVESMQQGAATLLENGDIFYSNQHLARLLKTPLQQLIGASIHAFVHPADASLFARMIKQAWQGGSEGELRFAAADGALIPVYLAFNRLQLGERMGLGLAVTDLTPIAAAQRLAEANAKLTQAEAVQLTTNKQLREADRRKDEFLAMLAHELRNPLAPIRNAVQILRHTGANEQALSRQRGIIERQVTHMARLLDDLLDVSRITSGKIVLKKESLHLTDVLAHAVETVTPLVEARHHTLHLAMPPDSLLVEGDIDRLAQVAGNLLTNAAKYTAEGGQIWLSAGLEEGQAVVRVRDNGAGIAPDLLPRVFDLFTQADQTLGRAQGGLGIGLTMVRSLVQLHGGTAEARSEGVGRGSEFIVRLPALPELRPETGKPTTGPAPASESRSRRILVVDDIEDTAASLAELLAIWGHETQVAHDGLTALRAAQLFRPEVVLLDIGMPVMDGYEVARRLRQMPESDKMLLVALTGYGQTKDQEATGEVGFDAHLVKPVDLDALRALLARAMA